MNEHIDALLRQLADDDVRMDAPPRVETAVMRAWRSRQLVAGSRWLVGRRQLAGQRRRLEWVGLPIAAAAVLVVAVVFWSVTTRQPAVGDPPSARNATMESTTPSVGAELLGRSDATRAPSSAPERTMAESLAGASNSTLPATSHQLPASNHQLPATGHRPQPTGHRPPVTGHRPQATGDPLPAASYQPSAFALRASADKPAPSYPATEQPSYVFVGASASDPAPLSVVRLRMARSALVTLGLSLPNPDAAAIVDVDVFVGDDGVARAIRPVALVSSVSQE